MRRGRIRARAPALLAGLLLALPGAAAPPNTPAAWVEALGSGESGARSEAVARLAAQPALPPAALDGVVALLAAAEAPTRAAALDVLEQLGPAAGPAIPGLVALFDASGASFAVRTGATRALDAIGPAAAEASLPRFRRALAAVELTPASARYRHALVGAISHRAGEADPALRDYAAVLERGLRNRRSWIRVEAARSLAVMGPAAEPALGALRHTLRADEERAVRALAAEALGAIGPAASPALPELRAAHEQDPNARVRHKAATAIERIGGDAR